MRLRLILARVKPTGVTPPSVCPYDDCQGRHFELHILAPPHLSKGKQPPLPIVCDFSTWIAGTFGRV
jgi:hypothetical protein